MQGEATRRAGEPSGQREELPPERLGGRDLLTKADPRRPVAQVVGHHLFHQPGGIGSEAVCGEMVQAYTVLQVANGILDLGVAAMLSLQSRVYPSLSVIEPW